MSAPGNGGGSGTLKVTFMDPRGSDGVKMPASIQPAGPVGRSGGSGVKPERGSRIDRSSGPTSVTNFLRSRPKGVSTCSSGMALDMIAPLYGKSLVEHDTL